LTNANRAVVLVDHRFLPTRSRSQPKNGGRYRRASITTLPCSLFEQECSHARVRPRCPGVDLLAKMLPQSVIIDPNHPGDIELRYTVADHRLDGAALFVTRTEARRHQHGPF